MGGMTEITGSTTESVPALTTDSVPDWEKRFRAPRVSLPDWAEDAPGPRAVRVQRDGDVRAVRLGPGDRRAAPGHRPAERHDGRRADPGRRVDLVVRRHRRRRVRRLDAAAVRAAAARRARGARASTPSYPAGLALGRDGTAVVGRSTDEDGTTIHVVRAGRRRPSRSTGTASRPGVGDLSHDGTLIAVEHTEHGDAMHSALRVVRARRHDGRRAGRHQGRHGGTGPGGPRLRPGRRRHPAARRAPAARPLGADDLGRGDRRGDRPRHRPAGRRERRVVSGRLRAADRAQLRGPQRAVALRPGDAAS